MPDRQTASAPERPQRALKDYAILGLKGMAMGSCDVVPGVSGGTMAFILGIYEELIGSLRAIGRSTFRNAIFQLRFRDAARAIHLPFLLSVLSGVLVAVISLAKLMEWLLTNYPVEIWSFFFGLIVASVLVVAKRISGWTPLLWISLAIAAAAAYVLVGLVPTQTPEENWFVFVSGALAICAMILPGISGAFILLILGKYQFIIGALTERDIPVIGSFAAGCAIGIISFAQLLGWLFKRYHDLTVAILTGLMLGSLRKVWPWKETLSWMTDRHGELKPEIQANIMPDIGGEFMIGLGLAVVGFVAVLLIERLGNSDS